MFSNSGSKRRVQKKKGKKRTWLMELCVSKASLLLGMAECTGCRNQENSEREGELR